MSMSVRSLAQLRPWKAQRQHQLLQQEKMSISSSIKVKLNVHEQILENHFCIKSVVHTASEIFTRCSWLLLITLLLRHI
jgi:hypothetical protein